MEPLALDLPIAAGWHSTAFLSDLRLMKCRYTFAVTSRALLDPPVHFTHRGWKFSLETDKGRFCRLVVEVQGVAFTEFPRIEHPSAAKMPHAKIPIDPMLATVQRELRAVRGALSLWGVQDIDTENPKSDWIPETQLERDSTDVLGIAVQRTPPSLASARETALDMIVRCFLARERFIPHEIPFEFYRRGMDDMYHNRFIEAVYDFYFVFEYLFGQGKFAKRDICEAFLSSPRCCEAIMKGKNEPLRNVMEKRDVHLTFHRKYHTKTVEEVAETMVSLRGFLHHQSLTRKTNWNPGLQGEFEADAAFLQRASFEAIIQLSNEVLFDPAEISAFHGTPVLAPDGGRVNWFPRP